MSERICPSCDQPLALFAFNFGRCPCGMPLPPSLLTEPIPEPAPPPTPARWLSRHDGCGFDFNEALGLLFFFAFAVFVAAVPLSGPFTGHPLSTAAMWFLAPLGALASALALHLLTYPFGRGLTLRSWAAVALLHVGLAVAANGIASHREWQGISRAIAEGNAGAPGIEPDAALKAAFLDALAGLRRREARRPTVSVRMKETHDRTMTPKMELALAIWKLDPDFAHHTRTGDEIRGARPSFVYLGKEHIEGRLREALKPVLPATLLDTGYRSEKDRPGAEVVFEVEAATRLEGTYSKYKGSLGGASLAADFRIEWKVRLLDVNGVELYSAAWTTWPAPSLSFKEVPIGAEATGLVQLSAHDNFARQLLGRLGLPPGPERKEWTHRGW